MAIITKKNFGTLSDGSQVERYTLTNQAGSQLSIITYGARVQSWLVPDKQGKLIDIVQGYADAAVYEKDTCSMGGIVGRHANRIQDARFVLNGKTYTLEANDGQQGSNSLHSGKSGFHLHLWKAEEKAGALCLTYHSPDGDGGFPGSLTAQVTYSLSDDNQLSIDYQAECDQDTICNMTNHTYFNLNGYQSDTILDHKLQIFAETLTEADADSLPNGTIYPAKGTPMDFNQLTTIGDRIDDNFQQLIWGLGYDHNWILSEPVAENGLRKAAYTESPQTGITLTTYTDLPGIQFYSGNFQCADLEGKEGCRFPKRSGLCLETQYYPNSPAHPEFPQPILKKGTVWRSKTIYAAGVK